jgi:hypothetical protein
MKKRRAAADSIDRQQENIENDEDDNNYNDDEDDNNYTHRFISMEEGWNDIIKPKVSV